MTAMDVNAAPGLGFRRDARATLESFRCSGVLGG
jgi:hypothetical protein